MSDEPLALARPIPARRRNHLLGLRREVGGAGAMTRAQDGAVSEDEEGASASACRPDPDDDPGYGVAEGLLDHDLLPEESRGLMLRLYEIHRTAP
jgi:hypothetical protein